MHTKGTERKKRSIPSKKTGDFPVGKGRTAVVAEKPSVARDIAHVLGAGRAGEGFLAGNDYIVTWALGHLVGLAQPHEIRPEWRSWRRDLLPMLPREWPLTILEASRRQFDIVSRIITAEQVEEVICATDAGREGELIFRLIQEAAGCRKPVRRLWISSLTPESIRKGFQQLRNAVEFDSLADAARGRSRADWLVGMNLSRAYTLWMNEDFSVGRVQTPTLAMVVEREKAIRSFVPEEYLQVIALFEPVPDETKQHGTVRPSDYKGTWFRSDARGKLPDKLKSKQEGEETEKGVLAAMRLPPDGVEAEEIVKRVRRGMAQIESIDKETRRYHPPLLFDLTELQRTANRLFGFSAQKTLDTAQSLYERHKLISYPRTDSRHLSKDIEATLPRIVANIAAPYQSFLAPDTGTRPLGPRFVDDSRVTDHHAIIPTHVPPSQCRMTADEEKVYDLVCRRLLAAWQDDHLCAVTTVITRIDPKPDSTDRQQGPDRFYTSGMQVIQNGWKDLDVDSAFRRRKDPSTSKKDLPENTAEEEQALPPCLSQGQRQEVKDAEILRKKTHPPKRFTDATLLTAMETAGKTLEEKELSDAMKECGLGTPATRAAIIETLLKRSYIERQGKSLSATDKGIRLIDIVHPEVKSPALTGQWEAFLKRIEKGKDRLAPFMEGIEQFVCRMIGIMNQEPKGHPSAQEQLHIKKDFASTPTPEMKKENPPPIALTPPASAPGFLPLFGRVLTGEAEGPSVPAREEDPLLSLLHHTFGFDSFRPNQKEICAAVSEGKDVLVVMPTGSGKSLCYQLPGLARKGSTLVVSPLIALMEDQVAQLRSRNLAADRIHSGRSRPEQQQAARQYLEGKLDFLFIAPERFRVPGFAEWVARKKPVLIAIDEAHCISQWGHDFRPDYRMLKNYIPLLRPTPVIALTATATPIVQQDIAKELDLISPMQAIHGFRRQNIAIEVIEAPPSARMELVRRFLSEEGQRPAIVYVPTRKASVKFVDALRRHFSVAAYHAGMDSMARDKVQTEFLQGGVDVMVATIAFGMGIDKANVRTVLHTAIPSSIEGYYQEIGRAGRDGLPSRAILMHSYADRFTHDFFFERDYPEPEVLSRLYRTLTDRPVKREELAAKSRMDADLFAKVLEKLWIHGGAQIDGEDQVTRGDMNWEPAYLSQRDHKKAQLDLMSRYTEGGQCRMVSLIEHFGDTEDQMGPCGLCDICSPQEGLARTYRSPTDQELMIAMRILGHLQRAYDGLAVGRLYEGTSVSSVPDRKHFERILAALVQTGLVEFHSAVFEKEGKAIAFRKARLTDAGRGRSLSDPISLQIAEEITRQPPAPGRTRTGRKSAGPTARLPSVRKTPKKKTIQEKTPSSETRRKPIESLLLPASAPAGLKEALRFWRLSEARRKRIPAFRVMSDRTLDLIAASCPHTREELLSISGVGPQTVEKYSSHLLQILRQFH